MKFVRAKWFRNVLGPGYGYGKLAQQGADIVDSSAAFCSNVEHFCSKMLKFESATAIATIVALACNFPTSRPCGPATNMNMFCAI